MAGVQTLDPVQGEATVPSAVAWINGHQASVAMISGDGRISTCEINRGWLPEGAYLLQLVRVIS